MARMNPIGSIDQLPSGKYRYRYTRGGKTIAKVYATETEAIEVQTEVSRLAVPSTGLTLADHGVAYLDWREIEEKVRDSKRERVLWKHHIAPCPIASLPLREIHTEDVEHWANNLRGARSAKGLAVSVLRGCLEHAKRAGLIRTNPAVGVRATGKRHKTWTYLRPHEILTLTQDPRIPEPDRLLMAFAIGTGLRQGEQWALQLADVHVDGPDPHVIVRWGYRGVPTKTGRERRVELFGMALDATKRQLERLAAGEPNEHGLLWPAPRGGYRKRRNPPQWLHGHHRKPGVLIKFRIEGATGHRVHWHSFRHTFASALVSGAWGRRWSLQEVAEVLGHTSTKMTELYAHLAEGTATLAAREHRCHGLVTPIARATGKQARSDDSCAIVPIPALSKANPTLTWRMTGDVTALVMLCVEHARHRAAGDPMAEATADRIDAWVLANAERVGSAEQATG